MPSHTPIRMVESPLDRTVVTDPAVRYRPERVKGARYEVKVDVPRTEKKRG